MQSSNIIPLPSLDRDKFAKLYVQSLQALGSYWAGYLLPSDNSILNFVVDRTLRWGKVREIITYAQIRHGVQVRSTGEKVNEGVNTSRRTIFRSVKRMEQKGFFSITRTKTTKRGFEANVFEINFKLILDKDVNLLRKVVRKGKPTITPLCHHGTTLVPNDTPPLCQNSTTNIHKDNTTEGTNRSNTPTAVALGAVVDGVIAVVRDKNHKSRQRKAAKLITQFTYTAVDSAWRQTILQYYPTVPIVNFTHEEFGRMRKAVKYNLAGVNIIEFFDWAVSQWGAMRSGRLAWMNEKGDFLPATPRLDVLARHLRTFAKAYADDMVSAITMQSREDREQELEARLREIESRLVKSQIAVKQLEQTNTRLRRVRRAPRPVRPAAPMSDKVMADAKDTYEQEENVVWLKQ